MDQILSIITIQQCNSYALSSFKIDLMVNLPTCPYAKWLVFVIVLQPSEISIFILIRMFLTRVSDSFFFKWDAVCMFFDSFSLWYTYRRNRFSSHPVLRHVGFIFGLFWSLHLPIFSMATYNYNYCCSSFS